METLGGEKRDSCLHDDDFIHLSVCSCCYLSPPLADAFSSLEEASVVGLLERVLGLSDEGRGPLDALLAAGYLLS